MDHRGLGRSDKPHDPEAFAMRLRAADAVSMIDELGIERAHFIGMSWGGRLGFGIGEHEPDRVLSLVISGQQPIAWPDSPLTRLVTEGLIAARTRGAEALVEAMERFVIGEGPVSENLRSWRIRCLIFLGAGDADFLELAERAANEIPNAELLSLAGQDHIAAHLEQGETVIEAVRRTLRGEER